LIYGTALDGFQNTVSTGNIGIGTSTPPTRLSVGAVTTELATRVGAGSLTVSAAQTIGTYMAVENTAAQSPFRGAFFGIYHNDGTPMLGGSRLGGLIFGGQSSSTSKLLQNAGAIQAFAENDWNSSENSTYINFQTTPASSTARFERMRVTAGGAILIGTTTNTMNAQLAVQGVNDTGIDISGNIASFFQGLVRNLSAIAGASADWVAQNNVGDYIDLGVNGSGGGVAPFANANETYMYASSSVPTLNIGGLGNINTSQTRFWTGDTNTQLLQMTVASTSVTIHKGSRYGVRSVSATGNILLTDSYVIVNTSGTTQTLPNATQVTGMLVTLKLTGNSLTVSSAGGTIDGAATFVYPAVQYESHTFLSDGTNWHVTQ
jgi:hypothetical protein